MNLLPPFLSVNPVLVAVIQIQQPDLYPDATFLRNVGVRIWESSLMSMSRKESVADLFSFPFAFSPLSQLPSTSCIHSLSSTFRVL